MISGTQKWGAKAASTWSPTRPFRSMELPHSRLRSTAMIASPSRLVALLQLIDRLPAPEASPQRGRGRPVVSSARLFLKALVVMVQRRLPALASPPHPLPDPLLPSGPTPWRWPVGSSRLVSVPRPAGGALRSTAAGTAACSSSYSLRALVLCQLQRSPCGSTPAAGGLSLATASARRRGGRLVPGGICQ